jgi:hypothetical protein
MEKFSSTKSAVFNAKHNLENSLGDDWQKYLSHLRKFFRNGNKNEFDKEIRKFLTNRQIISHNSFLLAVLNSKYKRNDLSLNSFIYTFHKPFQMPM